jgi:hypothetical protein
MAEAIALLHNPMEDEMSKLSRRSLVAGAATLPALAGSVVALTPDPAFAAVEFVQASSKAHLHALEGEPSIHSPLYDAWFDRSGEACLSQRDAEWNMVQTVPTTKAGAVAMITAYLGQLDKIADNEFERQLLESLAEAIPHLV